MDPISIIVSALVNGFMSGLGQEAAKDGYVVLKETILRKYKNVSIEKLEKEPESKVLQSEVGRQLRQAGADKDSEIVHLATGILELIETPQDVGRREKLLREGRGEELVEYAQWQGGSIALMRLFDKHFKDLLKLRVDHPISNMELLSGRIADNRNIPSNVAGEISKLHDKVRSVIQGVAIFIETRKYAAAEHEIAEIHLSNVDRKKAIQLVNADKKIHVSYQTLRATVEYFREMNEMIKDRIEQAKTAKSETDLALANAILVYELTDFVISYVENFNVEGYQEVLRLHDETKKDIEELRRNQRSLEQQARKDDIEPLVRNQTLQNIKSREDSITLLENEWSEYVNSVKSLQSELGQIKLKVPTLRLIRDDAQLQIKVLQVVEMLRILRQNISTIEATILTLENIKLISLSPERVKRLLGIKAD